VEIIELIEDTADIVFKMEQEIHNFFKEIKIRYEPRKKFKGQTECFKW
jgi:hypothetical protein